MHLIVYGFAVCYITLVYSRKQGPAKLFARCRRIAERTPLRRVLGDSNCETCMIFWLSLLLLATHYFYQDITMYCMPFAVAGVAAWLGPTISATIGWKEEN